MLGFIKSKDDLRRLKQNLVRSNTRSVYKSDTDDRLVENHDEIQRIADAIEQRRIELGKTSGFERLYGKVTLLYFGGMARHLAELRGLLDQAAKWIDEAAFDLEDEEGILFARKIRARLYPAKDGE